MPHCGLSMSTEFRGVATWLGRRVWRPSVWQSLIGPLWGFWVSRDARSALASLRSAPRLFCRELMGVPAAPALTGRIGRMGLMDRR